MIKRERREGEKERETAAWSEHRFKRERQKL